MGGAWLELWVTPLRDDREGPPLQQLWFCSQTSKLVHSASAAFQDTRRRSSWVGRGRKVSGRLSQAAVRQNVVF